MLIWIPRASRSAPAQRRLHRWLPGSRSSRGLITGVRTGDPSKQRPAGPAGSSLLQEKVKKNIFKTLSGWNFILYSEIKKVLYRLPPPSEQRSRPRARGRYFRLMSWQRCSFQTGPGLTVIAWPARRALPGPGPDLSLTGPSIRSSQQPRERRTSIEKSNVDNPQGQSPDCYPHRCIFSTLNFLPITGLRQQCSFTHDFVLRVKFHHPFQCGPILCWGLGFYTCQLIRRYSLYLSVYLLLPS